MINTKEINVGDVFSEISHYVCEVETNAGFKFKHLESGNVVELTHSYVENLLKTADQYQSEIKVGKLDKLWTEKQLEDAKKKGEDVTNLRVGDVRVKGIRTIFEEIHSTEVFTVCFLKQDKPLSKKEYDARVAALVTDATNQIEAARSAKKSVVTTATTVIENIIRNPILNYEPGQERILRGYKLQFNSRDGLYSCMDMDINEARTVNINTIQWLVFGGVKYILE